MTRTNQQQQTAVLMSKRSDHLFHVFTQNTKPVTQYYFPFICQIYAFSVEYSMQNLNWLILFHTG